MLGVAMVLRLMVAVSLRLLGGFVMVAARFWAALARAASAPLAGLRTLQTLPIVVKGDAWHRL